MVVLNRKTPRIDPWGQPPETPRGEDQVSPTLTDMVLFERKVASRRMTPVEAPFFAKEAKQC